MKKNIIFILVTIILLSSCENNLEIDDTLPLKEKIDQLIEPAVLYGSPNAMIIGIIKDGEKYIYSYGNAGLGSGPPHSNTIFEIGSNTKTFAATIFSEFISEGLLSLDDSINQFFPEIATLPSYKGKNITLKHLVTHTSGLPREVYNFNIDPNIVWSEFTNQDYYSFLNDISQQAYPFDDFTNGNNLQYLGTEFRYSNIGLSLLGHILEIVSGKTFEQLIEERICSKLNMPDTRIYPDLSDEQKSRVPKAYNINQQEQQLPRNHGRHLAAGSLYSTTDDMLNYMEANMGDSTSLSKSMDRCHQVLFTRDSICNDDGDIDETFYVEKADGIGMVWYITYLNGDTIVEHAGDYNHHFKCKFNKTKKIGIISFSNTANVVESDMIETIFNWINE